MKKNRALWRRTVAIAAIGVVVVAVWRYEAATPAQAASSGTAATTMASAQPGTADTFGTGAATPGPEERRLDVDALRRSLAGRPDADAEVKRIVAFARFRDEVAAYGDRRNSMPQAERAALAHRILDALPDHVARNEIMPVQAEALSAALLTDTEADPATRRGDPVDARAMGRLCAADGRPSPAQDPRYRSYEQQSRDVVRQVQASVPDPDQQQAVIAQRLQALRVQLFDGASSSGVH